MSARQPAASGRNLAISGHHKVGCWDRRRCGVNTSGNRFDLSTWDSPSLATTDLLHEQAGAGLDPVLWRPAGHILAGKVDVAVLMVSGWIGR